MLNRAEALLDAMAGSATRAEPARLGQVRSCDGPLLSIGGLPLPVGSLCRVEGSAGAVGGALAEVIGFRDRRALASLLAEPTMIAPGARVRPLGRPGMVPVGAAFLGRAVDALGEPIDGGGPVAVQGWHPLEGSRDGALARGSVIEPFDCGVRAINAAATLGIGQRIGLMAGPGLGKTVLTGQLLEGSTCDIAVAALVGERAREVADFVARHRALLKAGRLAVVAVPADHAPGLRLRAARFATALAEHFRGQGRHVLLLVDSLTRVAHAARETALLLGEAPAARGYPPSALGAVTRLVERAGVDATTGGAVTGIYTVLTEGDDADGHASDPLAETARAVLDGHIVLSRRLAEAGHFPAIDVPASLSRVMDGVVTPDHRDAARALRRLLAHHAANRELVAMGAHREGADPLLDEALAREPAIRTMLTQEAGEKASIADTLIAMRAVLGMDETDAD